ncbi:MAG TPA: pilus assembly protein PilM, partial [Sedimentisphaerales bacterium]|nr:pilus assembly protein PilM [Sedimentisphaerales bacterium]
YYNVQEHLLAIRGISQETVMAQASGVIWAVDVGNNLLKALRLRISEGGAVEVVGFDSIEHSKFLGAPDIKPEERQDILSASVRQFIDRNGVQKTGGLLVAVPGSKSFAKFIKLPPVEPKRIPEMVRYEAVQQIPSDINEVEWDWQIIASKDSPDTEVGIFFVKNEVLDEILSSFTRESMRINIVQMAPMALYNYAVHDYNIGDDQALIVLDMGSENTDLVVCTTTGVWQRSVPIGGNSFTKAIASAFRLDFNKAEKLKRTAPVSKYAKQIFQAMRPVFSDLAAEIQRSLGFYSSSHKRVNYVRIIALGGGMKLPGVTKYLQQTLQIPIVRPDSFEKLAVAPDVSAAKFHESVADFGVVYGLGLQWLGRARIETNLLPRSIARSMQWASKARIFTAAAAALVLVSIMAFARTTFDRASYGGNRQIRAEIQTKIDAAQQVLSAYQEQTARDAANSAIMEKQRNLLLHRDIVPQLTQTIIDCLPNEQSNPDHAAIYRAFREADVATLLETPRRQRPLVFVTGIAVSYSSNLAMAPFPDMTGAPTVTQAAGDDGGMFGVTVERQPGFVVVITGYSPYGALRNLFEPTGAGSDPSRWGFVTKLRRLQEVMPQSRFATFQPQDARHFSWTMTPLVLAGPMGTTGVGMMRPPDPTRPGSTMELIDPMTKETISAVSRRDGMGIETINDHLFTIRAKFLWKDAPQPIDAAAATQQFYE